MDAGVPSDSVIRGNKDLNYRAFLNSDPSHSSQQHRPLHLPRQRPIEGDKPNTRSHGKRRKITIRPLLRGCLVAARVLPKQWIDPARLFHHPVTRVGEELVICYPRLGLRKHILPHRALIGQQAQ